MTEKKKHEKIHYCFQQSFITISTPYSRVDQDPSVTTKSKILFYTHIYTLNKTLVWECPYHSVPAGVCTKMYTELAYALKRGNFLGSILILE